MLAYFPAALPDELLYSRLVRTHLHVCSQSSKQTLDDLFGNRSVRASIDLQCHLRALASRVPASVRPAAEDLAQATLLGYHAAFQTAETRRLALNSMLEGEAAGLHARLGVAAGLRSPSHRLRWCAACHEEALLAYGEPWWRRAHQLPGVFLCPTHGLPLRPACPPRIDQHGFVAAAQAIFPDRSAAPPVWVENPKILALLGRLARQSAALLDASPAFASFADLTEHSRAQFIAAGFASASGRLKIDALAKAAEARLAPLRGIFVEAEALPWILAMGRKHRHAFSPLQHPGRQPDHRPDKRDSCWIWFWRRALRRLRGGGP